MESYTLNSRLTRGVMYVFHHVCFDYAALSGTISYTSTGKDAHSHFFCNAWSMLTTRLLARNLFQPSRRNTGFFFAGRDFDGVRHSYMAALKENEHSKHTWQRIFYMASIPCLAITMWAALSDHVEHRSHERPDYIPYSYLNVRKKPFPWGDGNHTLFHNPSEQWVPGVGFEKEREPH
uniref:Cytochrome c oxidase subunit n=1 Tax=Heterorhabditis bacteriophora TaxID=37862 RepID=A0A1I7XA39_HETBA